ncbi:MAG: choice-of-anchor B family protein [Schleiferiaceae bacterium]
MKRRFSVLVGLVLAAATAWAQPSNDSLNMRRLAWYPVSQWGPLGASPFNNDIWGYRDTGTNEEFALVGNRNGVLVANVTNPTSSVFNELWVPGANSIWRDIKTWSHYAYAVHDVPAGNSASNGLLIINLDSMTHKFVRLPVPMPGGVTDTLRRAHNLWIDEEGKLYAFGSNVGVGGAVIVDVATDPWNPSVMGVYDTYYLHDGYARHDTLYGAALWEDIQVIGVALPSQPVTFGTFATPNSFAHNCWLSDDGNTLYTTDEVANGFVAAYDVNDLTNVGERFRHRIQQGTGVIPHNAHVDGNHVVTSYYTFGCHVLDTEFPELPVLAAYFDTSPQYSGTGYNGAWGAYPYLTSGRVLVNDIETGLWVLEADYPSVSRAEIQLLIRFGGIGGTAMFDTSTAKMYGVDYLYWNGRGDTLRPDANGKITIAELGALQDSLVWPSTMAPPYIFTESRSYSLGSGSFVRDTLYADVTFSVPEAEAFWTVAQSARGWELTSPQSESAQWTLTALDGRWVAQGRVEGGRLSLEYPAGSGIYVLETVTGQGQRSSQKLLRP